MKIGSYTLYPIETGRFALDGGAMFGVVPKTLWEKTNPPDEQNRIPMAARALLLVGDGKKILIDVGNGSKMGEKLKSIYKLDTSESDLITSLKTVGVVPEDITDVILSHLHFDHAGGSTTQKDERVEPTFPNATYYVQEKQWDAANNPTERDRASFFSEDFLPLRKSGVLKFTSGEGEVLPGLSVLVVNGHTTALQCPVISDGESTLLYCADLVPTKSHASLPWIMAYDLRPLVTLEEKRRILGIAADEGWTLFFEHDPYIHAAKLTRGEKGIAVSEVLSL